MAQLKAVYNNAASGALPLASVIRDTAKDNIIDGGSYGINIPSYGHLAARARYNAWVETLSSTLTWNVLATGYDHDNSTKMACAIRPANLLWCIWRNTDIDGAVTDGGSTIYELDLVRATGQTINGTGGQSVLDIMRLPVAGDTAHTESDVALRPRAGVWLPGCLVLLCERIRNSSGSIWDTEGVALVAMHHNGSGTFRREWLGDLDTDYLATPFHLGWKRIREWAMASYFPFVFQQNPVTDVFLSFTDYINDTAQGEAKKGGEAGLIRATRLNVGADWVFQSIFHMPLQLSQDDMHWHSAAWTPNGVAVSVGDGHDQNEIILFTCSDWANYTNGANWSTHRSAYGSGEYAGDIDDEHGWANQWAGCGPSQLGINTVSVGGDVETTVGYLMTVYSDDTVSFVETACYATGDDLNAQVCLGVSVDQSNRGTLFRSIQQLAAQSTPLRTPFVYSPNDLDFAVIARTPSDMDPGNLFSLYGTDIVTTLLGTGTSSIQKLPIPIVTAQRGLAIGPGAFNRLLLDGADYYSDVAIGDTTFTRISDASAPNSNPVYEIVEDGSSSNGQLFRINSSNVTNAFSATAAYLVFWVKNLEMSAGRVNGIPLRILYDDQGAGNNGAYNIGAVYPSQKDVNDWLLVVLCIENPVSPATPWADPHNALLRWEHHSSASLNGPSNWRFQMQGLYEGPQCPYLIAPNTTSANEQVEQRLTLMGANWTVGIELHIPKGGEDHFMTTHVNTVVLATITLATIYVDSNNYIEIVADLVNDEIDFDTVVSGSSIGVDTITGVALQRDQTIQLGVTFDGTNLDFYAACGGLDENGLGTQTIVGDIGAPTSVRIGDNDFSEVPNTELFMVAIDDTAALSSSGVLDLLADNKQIGAVSRHIPSIISSGTFNADTGASPTTTHTGIVVPTGASLLLLMAQRESGPADLTGVTYDGDALTALVENQANQSGCHVWVIHSDDMTGDRDGDIVVTHPGDFEWFSSMYFIIRNLDVTATVLDTSITDEQASSVTDHFVGPINALRNMLIFHNHTHALSDDNTGVPTGFTEQLNFNEPPVPNGTISHYISTKKIASGGHVRADLVVDTARAGCSQLLALRGSIVVPPIGGLLTQSGAASAAGFDFSL